MGKFLILIFLLIFPILLINPGLGRFYDSPRYICLAYSIANGNGYRFIFDPANKACFYNNFVLPYFLAPLVKFFGINFSALKGLMLLLALLSILMYSKWLENLLSPKESLYTSILLLFSPLFIMFADKIMSEMLFLFFLCLSLYIFEISQRTKKKLINFSLFIIVYLLIFTRIVGIALLFSLFFLSLKRKNKTQLLLWLLLTSLVLLTIAFIQSKVDPEDRYYHIRYFLTKNPFAPEEGIVTIRDLIKRISLNMAFYLKKIGEATITPFLPYSISFLLLAILGMLRSPFQNKDLHISFSLIYSLQMLIWPWRDERFLLPLLPILFLYFYFGMKFLLKKTSLLGKKLLYLIFLSSIIYRGFLTLGYKLSLENVYHPGLREFIELASWCRGNLEDNAVILSSQPALVYLLSFKKGVFLIYTKDLSKISAYIRKNKVSHILADRFNIEMKRYIYPWINENKASLKILRINGGTCIFEILNAWSTGRTSSPSSSRTSSSRPSLDLG